MATDISSTYHKTTKDYFNNEVLKDFTAALVSGVQVVKTTLRGNFGWAVVECLNEKNENGETLKTIYMFKIAKYNGYYRSKYFSETSAPFFYNCPESILKLSNCQDESAVEWREQNWANIKKQKEALKNKNNMVENQLYKVGNRIVKFLYHYKKSRFVGVEEGVSGLRSYLYDTVQWNWVPENN